MTLLRKTTDAWMLEIPSLRCSNTIVLSWWRRCRSWRSLATTLSRSWYSCGLIRISARHRKSSFCASSLCDYLSKFGFFAVIFNDLNSTVMLVFKPYVDFGTCHFGVICTLLRSFSKVLNSVLVLVCSSNMFVFFDSLTCNNISGS